MSKQANNDLSRTSAINYPPSRSRAFLKALAATMAPGFTVDRLALVNAQEKARKLEQLGDAPTDTEITTALVNFEWMVEKAMPKPTNSRRCERVRQLLAAYRDGGPEAVKAL